LKVGGVNGQNKEKKKVKKANGDLAWPTAEGETI